MKEHLASTTGTASEALARTEPAPKQEKILLLHYTKMFSPEELFIV
jgi:hypothetical protein